LTDEPKARPACWDAPLDEAPFCFVDLEMTGLDRSIDRVCEICLIRTQGAVEIDRLESLVWPDSRVGENAAIHGLTAEALAGAPLFESLLPRIVALLDGAILVGHAVEHDAAFLALEAARVGVDLDVSRQLDTLPLSRRCLSLASHRLDSVARALEVPLAGHHRAVADAEATRGIFFALAATLLAKSPGDLAEVKIGTRVARAEILALAQAAEASREEVWVRYRPARRAAEEAKMVITAVLADLDPPRVMGYLALGRSRRELRADRILAISSQPSRTEPTP
jgi:DNA polymerase-3 subunit epsilon